jgi:hypothetical protein
VTFCRNQAPDHPILIELDILGRCGQLVLALRSTICVLSLPFAMLVGGLLCYFPWWAYFSPLCMFALKDSSLSALSRRKNTVFFLGERTLGERSAPHSLDVYFQGCLPVFLSKTKLLLPFASFTFFCYLLPSHAPVSRGNPDFCQEKGRWTCLTALSWQGVMWGPWRLVRAFSEVQEGSDKGSVVPRGSISCVCVCVCVCLCVCVFASITVRSLTASNLEKKLSK